MANKDSHTYIHLFEIRKKIAKVEEGEKKRKCEISRCGAWRCRRGEHRDLVIQLIARPTRTANRIGFVWLTKSLRSDCANEHNAHIQAHSLHLGLVLPPLWERQQGAAAEEEELQGEEGGVEVVVLRNFAEGGGCSPR
jgi:hypothetical protein